MRLGETIRDEMGQHIIEPNEIYVLGYDEERFGFEMIVNIK